MYRELSPEQRAAYVFIRQEFVNGYAVNDAPLSYLFLCAYEIGQRARTLKSFESRLTSLRTLYHQNSKFSAYLAHWIFDARIITKKFEWDEIAQDSTRNRPPLRVDAQLLAHLEPAAVDLLGCQGLQHLTRSKRERLVRAIEYIRSTFESDPVLAASQSAPPAIRQASLFSGYIGRIPRFPNDYERRVDVPTFMNPGSPVRLTIDRLVNDAAALIGETLSPNENDLDFTRVTGTHQTVPITRSATAQPQFGRVLSVDTLEGLEQTVQTLWDFEMCLLMGLVLWLADSKPYVEGLIAFSRELRLKYETLSSSLHSERGIAPYRRAFYALSQGKLAPWILDTQSTNALDLKIGQTSARFNIALQHALRGSSARARLFTRLALRIAGDCQASKSEILDAFQNATGLPRPQGFAIDQQTEAPTESPAQ
jgi:hypothetical protein